MGQLHFSDETLMAFADGELDEKVVAKVEEAMASDALIAKRIAEFLRSRRLIRSAFPEETASAVSPELRAAVQAQIDRFEKPTDRQILPEVQTVRSIPAAGKWRPRMALAASIAVLAVATSGYLVGRQGFQSPPPYSISQLPPEVSHMLSESLSGQEQDLSFGRIRVISTFRMADGSLCREFKLQASSGTSEAVACRDHDWMITFALTTTATNATYVPSGGEDLMAGYLQNVGAGEPLLGNSEIEALNKIRCQR